MKSLKRFLKGNKTTCFLVKFGVIVEAYYPSSLEEFKDCLKGGKLKPLEIIKAIDMYNGNEWSSAETNALFEMIA